MSKLLNYMDLTDAKLGKEAGLFPDGSNLIDAADEVISNNEFVKLGEVKREYWIDNLKDKDLVDTAIKMRSTDIGTMKGRTDFLQLKDHFVAKFGRDYLQGVKTASGSGIAFKSNDASTVSLSQGNVANLAVENNTVLTETSMVAAVYDQIYPRNASPINQIFPEANYPTLGVRMVSFDPIRGRTPQRTLGQPFSRLEKRNYNFQIAKTRPFSEEIRFSPEESIGLRDPSSNALNERGINIVFSKAMEQLPFRKNTAVVGDLYDAVFNGWSYYQGKALVNYGIPAINRLTATRLGTGPWGSIDANGNIVPTNNNVLLGLRNLAVNTQLLSKYSAYEFEFFMNTRTLATIISNTSINPVTQSTGGPGIAYNVATGKVMTGEEQFISIFRTFGGISHKISVVVDDSQYIADAQDPNGFAENSVNYLCPDGKIFIVIKGIEAGIGQYAYTPVPQLGGTMNPQAGVAYWMVDSMASNTLDGTQNPFLSYNINFSALPLIFRPRDLFTLDITQ